MALFLCRKKASFFVHIDKFEELLYDINGASNINSIKSAEIPKISESEIY